MRRISWFLLCALVTAVGVRAGQEETGEPQPWYERVDFGGDLRFRYEGSDQQGRFDDGRRDRFRYRFRFGFEVDVSEILDVGVELRSGDRADPVSDNQDFSGGFDKDTISIAEAYVDVSVAEPLSIIAGKFSHDDYWSVSDMQWDDDVVVEGIFERFRFGGGGALEDLEATVYQLVLQEESRKNDAWLFGFQARPSFRLSDASTLTVGAGFDYLVNPQLVAELTLAGELAGNDLTNLLDDSGTLVSDFRILSVFMEWENESSEDWPIDLSLYGYKNTGAGERLGTETGITGGRGLGSENDTAFFGRVGIGGYSRPGALLFRYTYYHSEPDALFYAFMQSDTDRASNLRGSRVDVRVGLPARTYFNFSWYHTRPNLGEDSTLNRWQLDYILRF